LRKFVSLTLFTVGIFPDFIVDLHLFLPKINACISKQKDTYGQSINERWLPFDGVIPPRHKAGVLCS